MRKRLKIRLIIGGFILVLLGIWAGLTKAGIIPNWLGAKALYGCIDCKREHFELVEGDIPQLSGEKCCDGTYTVEWRKPCTKFGDPCPVPTI